jgi:hypothetical protein
MNTEPLPYSGLRRDGHLDDLALELALDGTPSDAAAAHLATCAACQARLDAARAFDDALPALPAFQPRADATPVEVPTAANRPWAWATVLLVAAVALFAATAALQERDDTFRVKGAGLALQVFKDEGGTSPRLRDGDAVEPGDRLGFRLRQRRAGHVMIIGVDQLDEPYLCYPQSNDGDAVELSASLEPRVLPEAIRLDDTRGSELLVAVLCDEPFTFDEMARAVADDSLPDDCVSDSVTLVKP